MKEQLSTFDWIKWSVATAVAATTLGVGVVVWAYSTFPTKEVYEIILQRLDRIENKVDTLLR